MQSADDDDHAGLLALSASGLAVGALAGLVGGVLALGAGMALGRKRSATR